MIVDDVESLVRLARAAPRTAGRSVIGIVGEPGAGKSTIAQGLVERLAPGAVLLGMDGFHLPQSRLVELGRRNRMGSVDTFDVEGFVAVLRRVRAGTTDVSAPGFDRTIEEPVPDAVAIPAAAAVVVVEGNYLLHDSGGWERILPLLDVSFYVHLPPAVRLERLVARHMKYGKSPEEAVAWANGPDAANARLIAATAARADHVIEYGGPDGHFPPPG